MHTSSIPTAWNRRSSTSNNHWIYDTHYSNFTIFHKNRGLLFFCNPKLDFHVLGDSCLNGASEMVGQLSTAVTTFLFNTAMMKLLGADGVATITIIIYSQFLLTTLFIGFSIGVASVFGSYIVNMFAEHGTKVYAIATKGFLIFLLAFSFVDLIFSLLPCLQRYPMEKYPQFFLFYGPLFLNI